VVTSNSNIARNCFPITRINYMLLVRLMKSTIYRANLSVDNKRIFKLAHRAKCNMNKANNKIRLMRSSRA